MKKLRKGTKISFKVPDELRFGIKVMGTIIGHAPEIKKLYPEEYEGLSDSEECYLVRRNIPAMGIVRHYVLFPEDVLRKAH